MIVLALYFYAASAFANSNIPLAITITAVDTLLPTFIGQTSATLSGNISLDQEYTSVEYYFEYGRTASYTEETAIEVRRGDNASTSNVIFEINKLTCASSYHYRLVTVLTDEFGTSVVPGNDFVFETAQCNAIELFVFKAISQDQDSAIIEGSFSASGLEATFYFTYGDTEEMLKTTTPVMQTGVTARERFVDISCGETYFFKVFVSTSRDSVESDVLSFDSIVCPGPPSVNYLSATNITADSVILRVSAMPNGAQAEVFLTTVLLRFLRIRQV